MGPDVVKPPNLSGGEMNVRFLLHSLSKRFAGLVSATLPLARELSQEVNLSIASPRDPVDPEAEDAWKPLACQTFPVTGPFAYAWSPPLRKHLNDVPVSLHHVHGLWVYPSRANLLWARSTGRPYIISPHGMLDDWALRHSSWKKRIAAWLFERQHLKGASCLHALCESEAQSIRKYGLKNPICIIPNGISLPETTSSKPPEWRSQLPQDKKVLLFMGRLHPKKGLRPLFQAWCRLAEAGRTQGWSLVIAGWDQVGHQAELEGMLAEIPRPDIHFIGSQFGEEKHKTFCAADAFILPSFSEGLPMTILEAWAYYLPVLMTSFCNLPEGFAAGAAVEIKPEADHLETELAQFFLHPEEWRREMGCKGRELVETKFTWPKIAAEMRAVYETLKC